MNYKLADYQRYHDMLERNEMTFMAWNMLAYLMACDIYPPLAYIPPVPMEMKTLMILRRN